MNQEESSSIILEHYRQRQYFAELDEPRTEGNMVNLACGDELTLYLRIHNKKLEALSYIGRACSVCIASADILCQILRGKTINQARDIALNFIEQLHAKSLAQPALPEHLTSLLSLRQFPIRRKCVLMAWEILLDLTR